MEVLRKDEDDWWYARHSDGREGSIPVPYVIVVSTGSLLFICVVCCCCSNSMSISPNCCPSPDYNLWLLHTRKGQLGNHMWFSVFELFNRLRNKHIVVSLNMSVKFFISWQIILPQWWASEIWETKSNRGVKSKHTK